METTTIIIKQVTIEGNSVWEWAFTKGPSTFCGMAQHPQDALSDSIYVHGQNCQSFTELHVTLTTT